MAEQAGSSRNQIQRYIRLTEMTPELLSMVDEKKIAYNPVVELSYLKKEEQADLLEAMDMEQATPSLSQAQRLKKFSAEGKCTLKVMCAIMSEEKKGEFPHFFQPFRDNSFFVITDTVRGRKSSIKIIKLKFRFYYCSDGRRKEKKFETLSS